LILFLCRPRMWVRVFENPISEHENRLCWNAADDGYFFVYCGSRAASTSTSDMHCTATDRQPHQILPYADAAHQTLTPQHATRKPCYARTISQYAHIATYNTVA